MERTKIPNLRNGIAKGESNPGSLDCESGILPLSYRAPYRILLAMCHSCTGDHVNCIKSGIEMNSLSDLEIAFMFKFLV